MENRRQSYRHGSLREALISDALELLKVRSVAELSVRELADRAGVSPRAPYAHFETKRDLLKAVAERGFQNLVVPDADDSGDLTRLGEAYMNLAMQNPNLFRLMFSGLLDENCAEADRSFGQVRAAVSAAQPEWEEPQLHIASLGLWALVHGLAELRLNGLISAQTWEEIPFRALLSSLGHVLCAVDVDRG